MPVYLTRKDITLKTMTVEGYDLPYIDIFDKSNFVAQKKADWKNRAITVDYAYLGAKGVREWKAFARKGGLQNCLEALAALNLNDDWKNLLRNRQYGLFADLGTGGGEKSIQWIRHLNYYGQRPAVAVADLSGSMVRAAAKAIVKGTRDIGVPPLAVVRAEFNQLAKLPLLLPEGFCDEGKPAIYVLLGQTGGNMTPPDLTGLCERNAWRVGDVVVIGLDLSQTFEGERANRESTKAMYANPETEAVWRRGADVGNTSGIILDPEIDEKYGPGTFSVVGYHQDRNIKTEIFRSTRWDERIVRRMFEERGFEIVAHTASPRRPTYKLLAWRRAR